MHANRFDFFKLISTFYQKCSTNNNLKFWNKNRTKGVDSNQIIKHKKIHTHSINISITGRNSLLVKTTVKQSRASPISQAKSQLISKLGSTLPMTKGSKSQKVEHNEPLRPKVFKDLSNSFEDLQVQAPNPKSSCQFNTTQKLNGKIKKVKFILSGKGKANNMSGLPSATQDKNAIPPVVRRSVKDRKAILRIKHKLIG